MTRRQGQLILSCTTLTAQLVRRLREACIILSRLCQLPYAMLVVCILFCRGVHGSGVGQCR